MFLFTGIAVHDKLGQQFIVDGEWQDCPAGGWIGGIIGAVGMPPLPVGNYRLMTNTGDEVQIKVTSMTKGRGARGFQPFEGIGAPPSAEEDTKQ